MKKAIVLILFALLTLPVLAQKKQVESNNFPISVGPYIGLSGGVNSTDPPEGIKNGFAISSMPDFGATFYMPFTTEQAIGGLFSLGYNTYPYLNRLDADEDITWVTNLNYVVLAPSFYFSGFTLGFEFGLPMGGSVESDDSFAGNFTGDIDSEDMGFMAMVSIGGMIPLFETSNGRMNFIINFGYNLTGVEAEDPPGDMSKSANAYGRFGFNYLFNLTEQ